MEFAAWFTLLFVVAIAPTIWDARRSNLDVLSLRHAFVAYYILQLGVSGIVTWLTGSSPLLGLQFDVHQAVYLRALRLSVAGLIAFEFGYRTVGRRAGPVPGWLLARWQDRRIVVLAALVIPVGIASFVLLLRLAGGLGSFIEARELWRAGGLQGQGVLILPATGMLAIIAHVIALRLYREPNRGTIAKATIVASYSLAVIPGMVLGFRNLFLLTVLQAFLLRHIRVRALTVRAAVALAAGLSIAFTAYGVYRDLPAGQPFDAQRLRDLARDNPALFYEVADRVRGLEVTATIVDRVDASGELDHGWRPLVEAVTILVPHRVWPDKPQPTSVRMTTRFFASDLQASRGTDEATFGGISATIVGDLYWQFGTIGVVLGLMLTGMMVRALSNGLRAYGAHDGAALSYVLLYTLVFMAAESTSVFLNGVVIAAAITVPTLIFLTAAKADHGRIPATR
jgi:hypothetical protein